MRRPKLSAEDVSRVWACPAMRVQDAVMCTNINRNRIYQMMAAKQLPYVMVGKVRLIPTEALRRICLEGLPPEQ